MGNIGSGINNAGDLIKQKALEIGFDACGIARADGVDEQHYIQFQQWLKRGYHAEMDYMTGHIEKRMDPRILVPGCKSVILMALNYHQINFQSPDSGYKVASYAAGKDYHYVMKSMMYKLLEFIMETWPDSDAHVFTDSAPVLERYWAQMAGIGVPGKNSCLILPKKGSYFFLGEILINIELPFDEKLNRDLCGNCTRCIDACPTCAIDAPGVINSQKCISWLTIEKKGYVSTEQLEQAKGFIFGCDICQQVCPHNQKFSEATRLTDFKPISAVASWTNSQWEALDQDTFKREIVKTKSPISRIKFTKLKDTISKTRELLK